VIASSVQDFFLRLLDKGKAKKSAVAAVMHKLIRMTYGILKEGSPFKPERALTAK
jgi:hypothetical protein